MNILITGGNGYIGSMLIQKILKAASKFDNDLYTLGPDIITHRIKLDNLYVIDNLYYNQTNLVEHCYRNNFHYIYGDVRDKNLLYEYINKADVIIPLAAIVGFPACKRNKELCTQINYEQIKFITENCSPDQSIIFPNTNSGYGIGNSSNFCTELSLLNPISHYGITKCNAENKVLNFDGKKVILRLATVFGASTRMRLDLLVNDFVYKALTDGYLVLFEKDFNRNYIHIQDVALTFIYAINKLLNINTEFPIYNVGLSSANLTKMELAEKIKQYIPNLVIKIEEFKKDPDQRNYIVSNEKLEKTGWKPFYSIDDGIQELIKAYKIIIPNNRQFTNL